MSACRSISDWISHAAPERHASSRDSSSCCCWDCDAIRESTASEHNKQGLQQTQEQDASESVRLSEAANKQTTKQPSSSLEHPQARPSASWRFGPPPLAPRVRALVLVSAACSGATMLVCCWHVASLAALCDSEPPILQASIEHVAIVVRRETQRQFQPHRDRPGNCGLDGLFAFKPASQRASVMLN